MAICCRAQACEGMFTERTARRSLKRYRAKGLDDIEQAIVDAAVAGGVADARVLGIGGGIGAIEVELLEAGAASGEVVELLSAYEPYARELALEKGLADRTTYRVADILDEPDGVDDADVVVLNRVICCSPDGVELAAAAAGLTRRTLVLSYPRAAWWTRTGVRTLNAGFWLFRSSFRIFLHPWTAILGAVEAAGLELTASGGSALWEYAAFRRKP